MEINRIHTALLFLLMTFGLAANAQTDSRYPVIPYPTSLIPAEGEFIITPATPIILPAHPIFEKEAAALNRLFTNSFGQPLPFGQSLKQGKTAARPFIELKYEDSITAEEGTGLLLQGNGYNFLPGPRPVCSWQYRPSGNYCPRKRRMPPFIRSDN